MLAFERRAEEGSHGLIFICNFTPVARKAYRIGLPCPQPYREIFNSDDVKYGGSGFGNQDEIRGEDIPWHGQPQSVEMILPPLACIMLEPI